MNVYDVFIRNDSNGNQNLQWFYFRMRNSAEFVERVTINIVNFTKGNSLFGSVSTDPLSSISMNFVLI